MNRFSKFRENLRNRRRTRMGNGEMAVNSRIERSNGENNIAMPYTQYSGDIGGEPAVINLEELSENNTNRLRTLWTGEKMQLTLMSIGIGDETGEEVHPDTEQILIITDGSANVEMGEGNGRAKLRRRADEGYAIIIPRGVRHNVKNIGKEPLKMVSIYAPREHKFGYSE